MDIVLQRQRSRFRFLDALYGATDGIPQRMVDTASLEDADDRM
jgi:hypothetical protein